MVQMKSGFVARKSAPQICVYIALGIVGGLVCIGLSVLLLHLRLDTESVVLGWAVLLGSVLGFWFAYVWWLRLTGPENVIIIDHHGVWDRWTCERPIPWDDFDFIYRYYVYTNNFSLWSRFVRYCSFDMIRPPPRVPLSARICAPWAWMSSSDSGWGGMGDFNLAATGTDMTIDDLEDAIRSYCPDPTIVHFGPRGSV
jgi:hypothetical protein